MREEAELGEGEIGLLQRLLVRPKRVADESDWGYHIRLAVENGLLPAYLPMECSAEEDRQLMGHLLPRLAMKSEWKKTSHVCISCLKETGVIKQSWRVRYVQSCAVHDEGLVMLKTKLGHAQNHAETLRSDLSELPESSQFVDAEEAEAHALFKSLWPDLASHVEPSAQSLGISIFLSSLLYRLTFARRGRDIQDKDLSTWVQIKRWTTANGIQVEPTVAACEKLLRELPTMLHQAVAIRWIELVLKGEAEEQTVLSALPLPDWLQLLRCLAGPIRMSGRGALGGVVVEAMTTDGLPVKAAARRAGLSKKRLIRMMNTEGVQPIRRFERKRKFLVIDVGDVQRLADLAHEQLTAVAAMSALQINGHRFIMRILRMTGTLTRVRQQGHDFYLASEIRGVLSSLTRWAAPYAGQPSVSLADPEFYRYVDQRVVKQMFDDIRSGHMSVWCDTAAQGLRAIRVALDVLNTLRRLSFCYRYGKRIDAAQQELDYAG